MVKTAGPRGTIVSFDVRANTGPGCLVGLYATAPNDRLQSVTINIVSHPAYTPDFHNVQLLLKKDPNVANATIAYVGSIGVASNPKGDLWLGELTVAGSIGDVAEPSRESIIAQSVNEITAGSDIAVVIESTGSIQLKPNGEPQAYGDVGTIKSTGGTILGSITAKRSISTVDSQLGSLGTQTFPLVFRASGGIRSLIGNSGFVDIQANVGTGSTGAVSRIETRTGDLSGIIRAHSLAGGTNPNEEAIKVAGALRANVEVQTSIDKSIRCGSLVGQVTANRANTAAGWNKSVVVNNATLSPIPNYTASSSTLGGGAVGLVPFRFYRTDLYGASTPISILPKHINNIPSQLAKPSGLVLPFYGPVKFVSGASSRPVELTYVLPSGTELIATSMIDVERDDDDSLRLVRIRGEMRNPASTLNYLGTLPAGNYKVAFRTGASGLQCDLGPTGPAVDVAPLAAPIQFTILRDCNGNNRDDAIDIALDPSLDLNFDGNIDFCNGFGYCLADFNGDFFLDFTDFDDFVQAFEAGAASSDFNADGFLDFTDFDAFQDAFSAGCA